MAIIGDGLTLDDVESATMRQWLLEVHPWMRPGGLNMAITRGFGTLIDLERGTMRNWVMGSDGVRRWADNGEPVDGKDTAGIDEQQCD